jgi:MFS family permease
MLPLLAVNAASALCQTIQIGALPSLIALVLSSRGLDSSTIGLIAAAPWMAIVLFSRFVPTLLHGVGLLVGVLTSALLTALLALAIGGSTNLVFLFMLNLVLGLCLIIRWIACDTWIVLIAPKHLRGQAIGVHETLMGLGIAAGPLVLVFGGTDSLVPFVVCSLLALAAIPWLLVLRKFDHKRSKDHPRHGMFKFLAIIPTGLAGAFEAGFVETSAISLLALYCMSFDYDVSAAVLLVSAFGLGGTLLQIPIGWVADRFGCPAGQMLCAATVLIGSFVIPAALGNFWLAALTVFFWGGAVGGMNTLAVMEAGEKTHDHHIADAMTVVAFFYTLGSMVGPVVSGIAMRYLPSNGLMVTAGLVSLLFLAVAFSPRLRRMA